MEVEAGSGDVAAEGASGTIEDVKVGDSHLKVTGENDPDSNDNDDDDVDTEGEVRRRHFDKNLYTFSAAAGRALQQQTSNIRNLVYAQTSRFSCLLYCCIWLAVWLSGTTLALINVVALCQTQLVQGRVTIYGLVNHLGM